MKFEDFDAMRCFISSDGRSSTSTHTSMLSADEEIGTVEKASGEVILLNADPFEDIRNTREIWKIIKNGEIVDRDGAKEMKNLNYMPKAKEE